jgi:hypothetical protein
MLILICVSLPFFLYGDSYFLLWIPLNLWDSLLFIHDGDVGIDDNVDVFDGDDVSDSIFVESLDVVGYFVCFSYIQCVLLDVTTLCSKFRVYHWRPKSMTP